MFDFRNSRYCTLNRGINLRLPPCYSSLYKSSFTLAASKLWNSLIHQPVHLKLFLNLNILWGTTMMQPRVTLPNVVCVTIYKYIFFSVFSESSSNQPKIYYWIFWFTISLILIYYAAIFYFFYLLSIFSFFRISVFFEFHFFWIWIKIFVICGHYKLARLYLNDQI
jgi:hypothetical protein